MRQKKTLLSFALVLTLVVPLTSCSGSASSPVAAGSYITMAMQSSQGQSWGLGAFPKTVGVDKCVIHVGMPGVWIPSICATSVTARSNDEATVRFVQRWNARDFFAGPPGRRHLTHTWEITVSRQAAGDHVVQSREYGDFPPQLSR
jgi:hypothetical protein